MAAPLDMFPNQAQNEVIYWEGGDGVKHRLDWLTTNDGISVVFGQKGRGLPPVALTYFQTPYSDGAALQQARYTTREIDIPIEIWGGTYKQCYDTLRQVMDWFDISNGEGRYIVTRTDGQSRYSRAIYKSGLVGAEDNVFSRTGVFKAIIVLSAGDPLWYNTRTAPAQVVAFADDYNQGLYTPLGTANFIVGGKTNTWPIWTITIPNFSQIVNLNESLHYPPADSVYQIIARLFNNTTGDYFTFVLNGAPPDVLGSTTYNYTGPDTVRVIDTRPGHKSIVNGSGTPVPETLTFQNLFPLKKGVNNVTLGVNLPAARDTVFGGGLHVTQSFHTAGGSLSMSYTEGYLYL